MAHPDVADPAVEAIGVRDALHLDVRAAEEVDLWLRFLAALDGEARDGPPPASEPARDLGRREGVRIHAVHREDEVPPDPGRPPSSTADHTPIPRTQTIPRPSNLPFSSSRRDGCPAEQELGEGIEDRVRPG
jgi:hypothetical protein